MTEVERHAALQVLEREVGVLMRRARRMVAERAVLIHPDLSPMGYLMLAELARNGPSRAADLAEAFCIDKGAVSRAVSSMIDMGLMERHADPEDGRAQILSAAPGVAARLDRIAEQRQMLLNEKLGSWGDAQIAEFVDAFKTYNQLAEESLHFQVGRQAD